MKSSEVEELLDSLVNSIIPRISFFFFINKVPDGDSHANNPSLEHSVLSPPISGVIIELEVVGICPAALTSPRSKVSASLESHESDHLVLNYSHIGESSGLVRASGVLADCVGVVVGHYGENATDHVK